MSLISASLLILVGIANSACSIRLCVSMPKRSPQQVASLTSFYSTGLLRPCDDCLLASLLWAVASQLIPAERWSDPRVRHLLLLTAGLVFIRTADSALINILRAQERSFAYNVYVVVKRYALLGTILVTVFYLVLGWTAFMQEPSQSRHWPFWRCSCSCGERAKSPSAHSRSPNTARCSPSAFR